MKVSMKYRQYSIMLVMTVVVLIMSTPVFASNSDTDVSSSESRPHGLTYGEWNARWWQWFFSVPASKNPGLVKEENSPVDCTVGQSDNVWFLAAPFRTSGSFTRNCTVPVGKALMVPLINSWQDNVCNDPLHPLSQLRADAASGVIPPENLHASIDGHPLTDLASHRAISPVFSYTLPPSPDNVINAEFGVSLPGPCWPSLTVTGAVADGFYAIFNPLTKGPHRVNFGGSGPAIALDITYNLTVN